MVTVNAEGSYRGLNSRPGFDVVVELPHRGICSAAGGAMPTLGQDQKSLEPGFLIAFVHLTLKPPSCQKLEGNAVELWRATFVDPI